MTTETFAELLKIRQTAIDEIRQAIERGGKIDQEWLKDRTRDVEYVNRTLMPKGWDHV